MALLEGISEKIGRIVGEFSESAALCSFLMCALSLFYIFCIRGIVSGLFEMHRSKSALKKISKNYSFGQRIYLKHAWCDCLHAKHFCRRLIVCHHCIFCLLLVGVLLALLSNVWPVLMSVVAWLTFVFVILSIPMCILTFSLERYPFRKWKHEYTFRKYHNTSDHNSLW